MTFTTSTIAPSVTTSAATSITATSATLNGDLTSLGTATSGNVSFEWGTTTSYGSETSAQSLSAIGTFNANLTGLTANTTYHFRAKAVGDGTTYGADMTFTTAARSGGMPVWGWVLVGLAGVAVVGGLGYFAFMRLGQQQ